MNEESLLHGRDSFRRLLLSSFRNGERRQNCGAALCFLGHAPACRRPRGFGALPDWEQLWEMGKSPAEPDMFAIGKS